MRYLLEIVIGMVVVGSIFTYGLYKGGEKLREIVLALKAYRESKPTEDKTEK